MRHISSTSTGYQRNPTWHNSLKIKKGSGEDLTQIVQHFFNKGTSGNHQSGQPKLQKPDNT